MEQAERTALLERAQQMGWYHTLDLAPGHVTPGMVDVRKVKDSYGLPERMDGMRVLDVGTWDGFWAFEMERRGADVVALDLDDERDLDWPPRRRPETYPEEPRGRGFRLAKELFESKVERVNCSIYNAKSEELGTFDLIFCGSVLIHLRDQLLALERIAGLCRGTFITAEEYDPWMNFIPFPGSRYLADRDKAVVYWLPSIRTWRRMLWTAGFDKVEQKSKFQLPSNEGWKVRHVVHHASDSVHT
jgi:tRNA (mo5U34)-methyltransferase